MNKKLLVPLLAVLAIGLPVAMANNGVPQALDEVSIAFEGINDYLISLDSRVAQVESDIQVLNSTNNDYQIVRESILEQLSYPSNTSGYVTLTATCPNNGIFFDGLSDVTFTHANGNAISKTVNDGVAELVFDPNSPSGVLRITGTCTSVVPVP